MKNSTKKTFYLAAFIVLFFTQNTLSTLASNQELIEKINNNTSPENLKNINHLLNNIGKKAFNFNNTKTSYNQPLLDYLIANYASKSLLFKKILLTIENGKLKINDDSLKTILNNSEILKHILDSNKVKIDLNERLSVDNGEYNTAFDYLIKNNKFESTKILLTSKNKNKIHVTVDDIKHLTQQGNTDMIKEIEKSNNIDNKYKQQISTFLKQEKTGAAKTSLIKLTQSLQQLI